MVYTGWQVVGVATQGWHAAEQAKVGAGHGQFSGGSGGARSMVPRATP